MARTLTLDDITVYIPSHNRADRIAQQSLRLFPNAVVLVEEQEVEAYAKVTDRLLVQPNNPKSLAQIRNCALRHIDTEVVIKVDDDARGFYWQYGWGLERRDDPEYIMDVLLHVAQCAVDAGTSLFGLSRVKQPAYTPGFMPFRLGWAVSGLEGIIGRKYAFDEDLIVSGDIDFNLRVFAGDRFVWMDTRWAIDFGPLASTGGVARLRSQEAIDRERRILTERWGDVLRAPTKNAPASLQLRQLRPVICSVKRGPIRI